MTKNIIFINFLCMLLLVVSCKTELGVVITKTSNQPTPLPGAISSGNPRALGIGPGNTLVLNEIVAATGMATQLQTYAMPAPVSAFTFTNNKTRILVEMDNTINNYSIDSTVNPPTLTLLSSASIPGSPGAWGICAAPDGTSAHLVGYATNSIYSFKISSDVITYASTITNAPDYMVNCKVTANSKFVIASGYYGGSRSFAIDATTSNLTLITSLGTSGAAWETQSEDSKFFFVANQDYGTVLAYELNLTSGVFALVDTKSISGSYPDFIDATENGTKLYVNSQNGNVYFLPFDRTTKQFGSESIVSTIFDWFALGISSPLYFQFNNSTGDTTVYPLNTNGSLGAAGSVLVDESWFQIL